ncbi:MAG: hypothetical protein M5U26_07165 [Planctomycetota bacterium]|nr:hypothetical protein [Planctomycetota bacterium]
MLIPSATLACGFCAMGPTYYLMPYLPTWGVVFLLWCLFRLKYDPLARPSAVIWPACGFFAFVLGGIGGIALWSFFLIGWTLHVALRLAGCVRHSPAPPAKAVQYRAAAWFHGQMLALLAAGLCSAGVHYFMEQGHLLPPY